VWPATKTLGIIGRADGVYEALPLIPDAIRGCDAISRNAARCCLFTGARRGSPGTVRLDTYQHRADGNAAEWRRVKRRVRHGYRASETA